jgi:hypothetical protein
MTLKHLCALFAALVLGALAVPSFAQTALVRFTGQLLDVRNGYVYFTTGDAFRLADAPRILDYDSGKPVAGSPHAKQFARAVLDPTTKLVVELDVTSHRLARDVAYETVAGPLSATKATAERAPEIVGVPISGKEVAVAFLITVPPTTPLNADVYISTDASGWNPQAIKLDRIDGQRYRAVRRFASGTKFVYRITRGSWNSVELGEDGLQAAPHPYFTKEVDAQETRWTVFAWSDDRGNVPQAAQPGAVPTPFNPNPFPQGGIAPPQRATPPGGFPTPRPPAFPNRPPGT